MGCASGPTVLMVFKDLHAESGPWVSDTGGGYGFWSRLKVLKQMQFDIHNLVTTVTGLIFTKLSRMVRLMILMNLTC